MGLERLTRTIGVVLQMVVLRQLEIEDRDGHRSLVILAYLDLNRMNKQVVISDAREVIWPSLHDARVRGFLLCAGATLMLPVEASDGLRCCLVLRGVEQLRADDFRQGNIILDVTVSSVSAIEMADVAYAYGVEPTNSPFMLQTIERLIREDQIIVRVNPSYGCVAVCICRSIEVEDDVLPQ